MTASGAQSCPEDDITIALLTNTETNIERLDAAIGQIRAILSAQP